jgi:polyhydroxyalkanoate synthase
VTPGKVVLRNRLMELIQYSPQTKQVHAEPILIVPAWIMKYYILDLSPKNSLVNYLTGLGYTVFMVSWKNPTPEDRDLSMDDYLSLGVLAGIDAINAIVPERKVHGVGYCIGGTLLSVAAAWLAGREDERLASVTLFAAQTDFSEPGELSVFISPSQLAMLEAMMWKEGVLDSRMMGGAFQLLRTYDLLWSPAIGAYVRGERAGMNDLMAWNADGTRMAYRMHSDYLRQLYLNNDLAEGRYVALGDTLDLANITAPMFVVGTETDHVAPWRSVYKVGRLVRSGDYTFCLTSGGHNAGIISGPQHPKRRHRVRTTKPGQRLLSSDKFLAKVEPQQGSWWPTWAHWLAAHSSKERVAPPKMGAARKGYKPLQAAPGSYVRQR